MPAYLLFDLFAPHGSFGAPSISAASSAWRWTELDPPRSVLVGLLGAALGLGRERQAEVDDAFAFAVRVDVPPVRDPLADYHTILPGRAPVGRERWSRLQEQRHVLVGGYTKGSIISRREYWTLGCWTVAVARRDGDVDGLADLAGALRRPVWPLYVGRRACPLGAPPDPQLVEAEDLVGAFRLRPPLPERRPVPFCRLWSRLAAATDDHREGPRRLDEIEEVALPPRYVAEERPDEPVVYLHRRVGAGAQDRREARQGLGSGR